MLNSISYRFRLWLIGVVLFFQKCVFRGTKPIKNVLVVENGGLGDFIMISPLVHALKESGYEVKVYLRRDLTRGFVTKVFSDLNYAGNQNSFSSDLIIFGLGASPDNFSLILRHLGLRILGFLNSNKVSSNFTLTRSDDYGKANHISANLVLLEYLGINISKPRYLPIKFIHTNGFSIPTNSICINLTTKGNIRNWPFEYYKELVQLIVNNYQQTQINLIGGKDDWSVAEELCIDLGSSTVRNFCGILSIEMTVALIENSRLLVSGDSGLMHIGFMVSTFTIAFFGPTNPENYKIDDSKKYVFSKNNEYCSFGVKRYKCMCDPRKSCRHLYSILPKEVFRVVNSVLNNSRG